jgi:alpha-beta hydrolase superfamily lysophospholipase
MMKRTSGTLKTSDGLDLYTEAWLPDGEPKAIVLIVHGLAEHIGRYVHVAGAFVQQGYAAYGIDHRGHGKSPGLRAYFENFDQPVEDLKRYFDAVQADQPGKKIFLYGHSLGSLLALEFTLRYQNQITGLVVSGSTLGVETMQPAPLLVVSAALNRLVPTLGTVYLDSRALSHDPAVVTAYDADPLVYRGNVRVRMGYYIVDASRKARVRLGELKLPMLILHGSADQICPVVGSQMVYDGAGSTDKTLKIYPELFHEIHNEPRKETVLADMVNWLDARAVSKA